MTDALGVSIRTVQTIGKSGVTKDEDYKVKVHAGHISARGVPLYRIHEHTIRARVYAMYSAG